MIYHKSPSRTTSDILKEKSSDNESPAGQLKTRPTYLDQHLSWINDLFEFVILKRVILIKYKN